MSIESIVITPEEYVAIHDAANVGKNWLESFAAKGNELLSEKGISGKATGAVKENLPGHSLHKLCYEKE